MGDDFLRRGMKKYFLILLCFTMCFLGTVQIAVGAPSNFYEYVTEMSIGEKTWTYGDAPIELKVNAKEPLQVNFVLYFTKGQWKQSADEDGTIYLDWEAPSQIKVQSFQRDIIAEIDGKAQAVGQMDMEASQVHIVVDETYRELIADSDNIEFRLNMIVEFEEGSYDLGEWFEIESVLDGQVSARWNDYGVYVNKIDENDSAKLLEGAEFEINVLHYSKDAYAFENSELFSLAENNIVENGTFQYSNEGFKTVEHVAALLEGGFEPGKLYKLREVKAPIGYIPSDEEVKFAFYHYTDSEKTGTLKKIQELNKSYTERYENEGGVAVFGSENGSLDTKEHNIYIQNKKMPMLKVIKVDAVTGEPIENVRFELQIDIAKVEYTTQQYMAIENAGWEYNEASGVLSWIAKTDQDGVIIYPEGTIPYASQGYSLVETVPEGYEGYGSTLEIKFLINKDGTLSVTEGNATADVKDGVMILSVENKKNANLIIHKENESGDPLAEVTFALYGEGERFTGDTIEVNGKTYYYLTSETTGKDGKIVFEGLSFGKYYLVEMKAPEGYKLLEEPYLVELDEESAENKENILTIVNSKEGAKIVATGGKGIWPYLIGGILLIIIGRILLINNKKKRRRRKKAAQRSRNAQHSSSVQRSNQAQRSRNSNRPRND